MTSQERGKRILIVNDTEEIVELFRDIVEGMGHSATAITYAPEDLHDVKRAEPDLVILDLMIGAEARGWQLAQKMRMSPETARIPIIVCSAALEQVREQEGWLAAQGIKVVLKPFQIDDLELAITKALALPELLAKGAGMDGPPREPRKPRGHAPSLADEASVYRGPQVVDA